MSASLEAPGTASAPRPIQRYGLLFGAIAGLIALVQVGVSVVSALENRYTLTNLAFSKTGGDAAVASALAPVFPLVAAAYGTCLVGFAFTLVLCWHAGRAAALETGRAAAGTEAGLLVIVTSSLIWVIASVVAVLLFHTDGSVAGLATASATLSSATDASEIAWLVGQETLAILMGIGAAALAGRLAGGAAVASLQRAPVIPYVPAPASPGGQMPFFAGMAPYPPQAPTPPSAAAWPTEPPPPPQG
ncbi:MAG TPA: hypothetical protein VGR57_00185 [Ktedonobacterales bacterium]|nr:hypothetical protein [Ktedonobacterales bacterium]